MLWLHDVTLLPVLISFVVYVGTCYLLTGLRSFYSSSSRVWANMMVTPDAKAVDEGVCVALSVSNLCVGALGLFVLSEKGWFAVIGSGAGYSSSSLGEELAKLGAMFFLSDTLFYWSHRFLHVPWFYRRYHKLHHTHISPIPWTALFVHPGEFLLAFAGIFVSPPLIVAWYSTNLHWATLSFFWSLLMIALVSSHSGLYLVGAQHHEAHHITRRGNYGSKLGVWDRLLGTTIDEN